MWDFLQLAFLTALVILANYKKSLNGALECTQKSGIIELKVNRIALNIEGDDLKKAEEFYGDIFGLDLLMDIGWIRTFGTDSNMKVQISIATEGGSGTPVPDVSIEVDDIETALKRVGAANIKIEYGPEKEPWGVRRFYIRDPFGKLINVLQHE